MGSSGINLPSACAVFVPITWSSKDTLETVKQVREHNAAWKTTCGKALTKPTTP